jgi:oligopeptide transport system permease protein
VSGVLAFARRHPLAATALAVLAMVAIACVLGPRLSTYRYDQTDFALGATPPSRLHWLGTDPLGRDVLVRALVGGRVSLACALLGTALGLAVGLAIGATAGYVGGAIDLALMRGADLLATFPTLVLVVLVAVFFGSPQSAPYRSFARAFGGLFSSPADPALAATYRVLLVSACLGATSWPSLARVVRSSVLAVRAEAFVDAAVALGLPPSAVLVRHVLPNAMGPILAYAALTVPETMMGEAFLSFVGVGTSEPLASWGLQVAIGAESMLLSPWQLAAPGGFLLATLLAVNFAGDELQVALDPRARR